MRRHSFTPVVVLGALVLGSAAKAETACAPGTSAIPDGSGSHDRTIVVAAGEPGSVLSDLRVTVTATHPWIGDLRLVLRHPSGTEVVLLDRPGFVDGGGAAGLGFPGPWGCGGDGLAVTFDDDGALDAETTCEVVGVAITGPRRPIDQLSTLLGRPAAGEWVLVASDLVSGDVGSLDGVCLEFELAPGTACPADLDGAGGVDGSDLAILLGGWGTECRGCPLDLTGDGIVDAADLGVLLGAWG